MGMAIVIPSGMLWELIAKAKDKAKLMSVEVERKVGIPWGILCIIIASLETTPNLYKFLLLILLFSLFGKNLSISIEIITPRLININKNKRAGKPLKIEVNKLNDSGIKSVKETHIITPLAKDREAKIIFFSFFKLKSRGIKNLKVLYSKEEPKKINYQENINNEKSEDFLTKRKVPASISFVPSVAGLIIAGEVIKDLIKENFD